MFKRPHYLALSSVLFLVLIVLSLPNRTAMQLKLALGGLFLPLFGLAGSAHSVMDKADRSLTSRRTLLDQLDQLQHENEQFRLESMQWAHVAEENAKMREALGWQQQTRWKLKPARVVLRDPASWWRTVQIDVGQRHGVVTNSPVLTTDGLVGRIVEVAFSRSQVVLIGDPKCRVAALVETGKNKGVDGIIFSGSSAALDPRVVDLTFMDGQAALQPGQKVVTSGLSGLFPRGLNIGEVIDFSSVGFGMNTEARVRLAADIRHLDIVFVLFP
jgi:rod shape-determining protein MreC